MEESHLAIILCDHRGKIRLWNNGAAAMFGYSPQEALGTSLDIIVPERHRARHNEGYERVMQTGATKYGSEALAVPAMRKDGSRISIEFTISLVSSPQGEVLGVGAIVHDVTARWQRDRMLHVRLAELESRVADPQVPQPTNE